MKSSLLLFGLFAVFLPGIAGCDESPQGIEENDLNTQQSVDMSAHDKCSQDTDKDDIHKQRLIDITTILGDTSRAGLLFDDHHSVEDTLKSFQSIKDGEFVVVFNKNGDEFASYFHEDSPENHQKVQKLLNELRHHDRFDKPINDNSSMFLSKKILFNSDLVGFILVSFNKNTIDKTN